MASIYDESDPFLRPLVDKLRQHPKRVVFTDGKDPRVLRVAAELVKTSAVSPILLGKRREIEALARTEGVGMELIGVVHPEDSGDFVTFCERYRRTSRYRKLTVAAPEETMARGPYFGAMMLQYGYVDALVRGNIQPAAGFFRALFHMIPKAAGCASASCCLGLRVPHRPDLGKKGIFYLADSAVAPAPTFQELATTAVEAARVAGAQLGERPRVAMLSHSTKGTSRHVMTDKMAAATVLARKMAREARVSADFDGEVQLDAAIAPEVAERKVPGGALRGRANVLIFPDLNSSNIAAKIFQHVAGAQLYGHMVLGLTRPAAYVSCMTSDTTLFAAAVSAAFRSIQYRDLVQGEELEL